MLLPAIYTLSYKKPAYHDKCVANALQFSQKQLGRIIGVFKGHITDMTL